MDYEIEADSALRIILQFLRDAGLHKAFHVLQEECGVRLGVVGSIEKFCGSVLTGKWDQVLLELSSLDLPPNIVDDLYEQIFLEMVEKDEVALCNRMLTESTVFKAMQQSSPLSNMRFKRLENLLKSPDGVATFNSVSRATRRKDLAEHLRIILMEAPPARLQHFLSHALLHGRSAGFYPPNPCKVNLLTGQVSMRSHVGKEIRAVDRQLVFPKGTIPECCVYIVGEPRLITGSSDGLVEIWSTETGKLDTSIGFQAAGNLIIHPAAVSCMEVSSRNRIICGDVVGDVRVWDSTSGACVREFVSVHTEGITALSICRMDDSNIMSASLGGGMKMLGIKSGRVIREYPVGTGYVTSMAFLANGHTVAGYSDGRVRIFAYGSSQQIHDFQPTASLEGDFNPPPVSCVCVVESSRFGAEMILVCTKSDKVHLVSTLGEHIKAYSSMIADDALTSCVVGPGSEMFYCASVKGLIHSFSFDQPEPASSLMVSASELSCLRQNSNQREWSVCSAKDGIYLLTV